MHKLGGILLVVLLLALGGGAGAQELAPVVLLTEDELLDALRSGEITSEQYEALKEILANGVDSTTMYLLDEVPNLTFFHDLSDSTQIVDAEPQADIVGRLSGNSIRHRYVTLLDEDERRWYRTDVDMRLRRKYRLKLRVSRERSGKERLTDRSITYADAKGMFRRVTAGSFTTRLGLGTAFGHRGKLLDFSDRLDGESFLMPDQSAYNGVLVTGAMGALDANLLGSVVRDPEYRLVSGAMMLSRGQGEYRPGLIVGYNELANRASGVAVQLPVIGCYQEYRSRGGYVAGELSVQEGDGHGATAAVVEGRHRYDRVDLRFAGWSYSDRLVELTAGSKAGSLTVRDTLDGLDFVYSVKRAGQAGALLKTDLELTSAFTLSADLIAAQVSHDNASRQMSGNLTMKTGTGWQMDVEYLQKWRRRVTQSTVTERDSHRLEFGMRFKAGAWAARTYIAGSAERGYRGFMAWFTYLRCNLSPDGYVRVWSNLSRFGAHGIDHWYGFISGSQRLMARVTGAVKLAHTYRRSSSDRHETVLSFEVTVTP